MINKNHFQSTLLMALAVAVTGFFSVQALYGTLELVAPVRQAIFWTLLVIWLVMLPAFLVKPLNVWVAQLMGARKPNSWEWQRINPLWYRVATQARVRPDRYLILIVDDDFPQHRDFGFHVVAISRDSVTLDNDELAAVLAQRLARQTTLVAPLLGLCAWAAMPFALVLAVSLLAFLVIHTIRKVAGAVLGGMKPRSDEGAMVWLAFLVVAIMALGFTLLIGLTIFLNTVFALAVVLAALWLARRADLATDSVAVRGGHGPNLLRAVTRLGTDEDHAPYWLRAFATFAPAKLRLSQLRRRAASHSG